jgi:hypothetical protein
VRLGGVRAEGVLGAVLLILTSVAFLPMAFLALGRGDGAATTSALRLPAHIFARPVLGPLDEAPTESALGAHAETRIAWIEDSLSKPGMWDKKFSKDCDEIRET